MDLKALSIPFDENDIEWRIAQKGVANNKPWAKVLAYITNRAIMQRLDEVVGHENWKNEFTQLPGAFLCGLSIRVDGEWITKWDGAQESQIEATKGGLSGSMKRAAVQWGIGRYLYGLEENFARVHDGGRFYCGKDQRNNVPAFKWDAPALPAWAMPTNDDSKELKQAQYISGLKTKISTASTPEFLSDIEKTIPFDRLPQEIADELLLMIDGRKTDLGATG